jgi:hypothetical protein
MRLKVGGNKHMTKVKLTEKILMDTPLGNTLTMLENAGKHLSSVAKSLSACYVVSIEKSEPVVDPFLARNLILTIDSDHIITQYLDVQAFSQLKTFISTECDRVANSYEARLRPFCEKNNISLEGRYPKYYLAGFIEMVVDQVKGICKIGNNSIKSLMLESIAPTLLEIIKTETERPFDISSFLRDLSEAYEKVTKLKGIVIGQPTQILDVFQEIVFTKQSSNFKKNPVKSNFKDYTRESFARDLARLSSANITVTGKRMELMPTAFPHEDGLPIRIGENVRYAGRIKFNEVAV